MGKTFPTVWYLPSENKWSERNLLAYRDVGTLTINENEALFVGRIAQLRISDVRRINYGKQGRDFINNWVAIEFSDGKMAFFADGSHRGWGGIFGGTKKILNALRHLEALS